MLQNRYSRVTPGPGQHIGVHKLCVVMLLLLFTGRYKVFIIIAMLLFTGGYGFVFIAQDIRSNKLYALKVNKTLSQNLY